MTDPDPIPDLLDNARIAMEASEIAGHAGNRVREVQLRDKAKFLTREAERLDPSHLSPAWKTE